MRLRVTPVPIPNTMVKTQAADGTSLETVRESRLSLIHIYVSDNPKIYVEDYVDTYLNQLREKAREQPVGVILLSLIHI